MKSAFLKMIVLAAVVFAVQANGISVRNFDGPPTPVCTPTGCLPPIHH
jgi:hypothetical protein